VALSRLAVASAFCCAVAAVVLAGCGQDGPERAVVSGTVTYQGKPLEEGQIRFLPVKGTEAPVSGGAIRKGEYRVDAKGGVPVGTHRIEIIAYRVPPESLEILKTLPPDATETEMPPREQYIPAKYNADSELEITIPPGSGAIRRDFQLTD